MSQIHPKAPLKPTYNVLKPFESPLKPSEAPSSTPEAPWNLLNLPLDPLEPPKTRFTPSNPLGPYLTLPKIPWNAHDSLWCSSKKKKHFLCRFSTSDVSCFQVLLQHASTTFSIKSFGITRVMQKKKTKRNLGKNPERNLKKKNLKKSRKHCLKQPLGKSRMKMREDAMNRGINIKRNRLMNL